MKLHVVTLRVIIEVPCFWSYICCQSCNSLPKPQYPWCWRLTTKTTTPAKLKAHKLFKVQSKHFFINCLCSKPSSQIIFAPHLLHKLFLLHTFFTNWFHFKPSSQTSWTLDLFCKKHSFQSHSHCKKRTGYMKKLLWSYIKKQFWICSGLFYLRKCSLYLFMFIISFA
jgi:hypothetical protein